MIRFLFLAISLSSSLSYGAQPLCATAMELLNQALGSTASRSPGEVYLGLIEALVRRNSLSKRFMNDLIISAEPLNPFDYEVKHLSIEARGQFSQAFKTLFKRSDLKKAWQASKEKIADIFVLHNQGQQTRQQFSKETAGVWAPVKVRSDVRLPLDYQRSNGVRVIVPKPGGGYWVLFHDLVQEGLSLGDSKSKKFQRITKGEFEDEPQLILDPKGKPFVLFRSGIQILLVDGSTGDKKLLMKTNDKKFKNAPWNSTEAGVGPLGYFDENGNFILVLKWWDGESYGFGKIGADGQVYEGSLRVSGDMAVKQGPDGKLYVGGVFEGKAVIGNISDDILMGIWPAPRVGSDSFEVRLIPVSPSKVQMNLQASEGKFAMFDTVVGPIGRTMKLDRGAGNAAYGWGDRVVTAVLDGKNKTNALVFGLGEPRKLPVKADAKNPATDLHFFEKGEDLFLLVTRTSNGTGKLTTIQILDLKTSLNHELDLTSFDLASLFKIETDENGYVYGYFYRGWTGNSWNHPIVRLRLYGPGGNIE